MKTKYQKINRAELHTRIRLSKRKPTRARQKAHTRRDVQNENV